MIFKSSLLFLFSPLLFLCQEQQNLIRKDLDGDAKADKIYLNPESQIVTYELSSQGFKKVSTSFADGGNLFISPTHGGFEIRQTNMRSGNAYQFRYEKETDNMRLIGMSQFNFGPANNDGSGESSVNLLTNEYIGEWNYFDLQNNKLVKIPKIKKKMIFPKTYFNNLGDVFSRYSELCSKYYEKSKSSLVNK